MKKVMALVIACVLAIGIFSINAFAADEKLPGGTFFTADAVKKVHYRIGGTLNGDECGGGSGEPVYVTGKNDISYITFTLQDDDPALGMNIADYPILVCGVSVSREFAEGEARSFKMQVNGGTTMAVQLQSTTDLQLAVFVCTEGGSLETIKPYFSKGANNVIQTYTLEYFAFFKDSAQVNILRDVYKCDLDAYIAAGGSEEIPVATEIPSTQAPVTNAPTDNGEATQAPATEVPATKAPATEPKDENKGGCGSSGAIAQVMLILGAALIIKKRK